MTTVKPASRHVGVSDDPVKTPQRPGVRGKGVVKTSGYREALFSELAS